MTPRSPVLELEDCEGLSGSGSPACARLAKSQYVKLGRMYYVFAFTLVLFSRTSADIRRHTLTVHPVTVWGNSTSSSQGIFPIHHSLGKFLRIDFRVKKIKKFKGSLLYTIFTQSLESKSHWESIIKYHMVRCSHVFTTKHIRRRILPFAVDHL